MKKTYKSYALIFFCSALLTPTLWASSRHLARIEAEESLPAIRLLTFDGGGMRGYISLKIAEEVKKRLGWQCLSDGIEWFAGSSTGSIVATGLSNGLLCEKMEDIYLTEGPKIFTTNWWRTLFSFQSELYDDAVFVNTLKNYFQDQTMASLRRDLIVLAHDIEGGEQARPGPVVFNSGRSDHQTMPLWKMPRASASAPTYFKPFYGFTGRSLVDGGVLANMPTQTAIASILGLYDNEMYREVRDNIKIVSIGTGMYDPPTTRTVSSAMGFLDWAPKITPLMMRGAINLQVENLSKTYRDNFVRLNPRLDRPLRLDSARPEDFSYMAEVAQAYIQSHSGNAEINRAVTLLQGDTLNVPPIIEDSSVLLEDPFELSLL